MPIGRAGYQCRCGHAGCAETELSVRKYNDFSPNNPYPDSLYLSSVWNEFLSRTAKNDEAALRVIADNGHLLGTLAPVLFNLLDPQEIIIGGDISAIADRILPFIQEEFESCLTLQRGEPFPVCIVSRHNRLILAGYAKLALSNWNP